MPDFNKPHILIVVASFYKNIADMQLEAATDILKKHQSHYDIIHVPGALEIPSVISLAASEAQYNGYIALGCVIRGETFHFEIVCQESARALMSLSIQKNLLIGNGILTVDTQDQAIERADKNKLDKAGQAAEACLSLIKISKGFRQKS